MELLYFAWVRESIGLDGERIDPPADVRTVADLIAWLARRGGGYAEAFADPARIRAAVDQAFVQGDAAIAGAKEIALFPPVTGG
ncbi:molybdopterin converting factor subunit 1 [Sphingobium boeckii]|uniref:Molybdopterin synthase sulfur carrier subunit n=1 Tax=Sphingobium boeckii TaxID=1082345 RepID=A0A7W9AH25_9SPHN|nr:molybdopterin converting factor subunit 1 [Sphingobium boeckii]MBB5685552.1 molybdopterin synthase sulfur carrier subunit [Sphingobium boeckii]